MLSLEVKKVITYLAELRDFAEEREMGEWPESGMVGLAPMGDAKGWLLQRNLLHRRCGSRRRGPLPFNKAVASAQQRRRIAGQQDATTGILPVMGDEPSKPYSEMIVMLRSTLRQAEHDLSLHPNDPEAIRLRDSIKRMLDGMDDTHHAA
jgi:hypothetical protein